MVRQWPYVIVIVSGQNLSNEIHMYLFIHYVLIDNRQFPVTVTHNFHVSVRAIYFFFYFVFMFLYRATSGLY